jgi:hypothetical protein
VLCAVKVVSKKSLENHDVLEALMKGELEVLEEVVRDTTRHHCRAIRTL